jgi:hypothetical protein
LKIYEFIHEFKRWKKGDADSTMILLISFLSFPTKGKRLKSYNVYEKE